MGTLKGTLVEWSAGNKQGGLNHSPVDALEGGGVPPVKERQVAALRGEWEAVHEFVHGPTITWLYHLMEAHAAQRDDPALEQCIEIATHCASRMIFRAETKLDSPEEAGEAGENMYRLINTALAVGACLYRDALSGKLIFDGKEEPEEGEQGNDA